MGAELERGLSCHPLHLVSMAFCEKGRVVYSRTPLTNADIAKKYGCTKSKAAVPTVGRCMLLSTDISKEIS